MIVRHTCNNRLCTNPEHLKLGTPKENSNDMIKSKRQAFGSKNGNSKLSEDEVKVIKSLLEKGKSYSLIAELFSVHKDAISNIKLGITWKHVED
jgi:DNA invertase Pin-like site-specific DNA recombinase